MRILLALLLLPFTEPTTCLRQGRGFSVSGSLRKFAAQNNKRLSSKQDRFVKQHATEVNLATKSQASNVNPRFQRMALEDLLISTDPTVELQGQIYFDFLQNEARDVVRSPVIGQYVNNTILQAHDLPNAMGRVLVSHLQQAQTIFNPDAIAELILTVCEDSPKVRRGLVADLTKAIEADLAVESMLQPVVNFKGLHAITLARIAHHIYKKGTPVAKQTAFALQSFGANYYGIDIHPAAKIGNGIFVDHATGLVIGATAVVGDNILILHGVTLGATGKRTDGKRHPTVENGVTVGALATVLGDVTIGAEATVGAQAVVTKDVMTGETVVGINKVLDGATKRQRLLDGQDKDTWLYNI